MNAVMENTPAAPPSLALYRRIATVFLALTVLVVVLVAYVVLSRATVVVMSKQEEASADFIIDVARDPQAGEVKGEPSEITRTVSQTFPSTSLVKIDAPAEGRVRISSTFFKAQTLVATTRLLTPDGVLFRIKRTVVVPAGGSVEVDAFADQPGSAGDVGNTTFTIPGLNEENRKFFTVRTVTPMEGGLKEVRLVTKQDVESAEAVLREKLAAEAVEALRAEARAKDERLTGEVVTTEVLKKVTDVPVGAEAGEFTLTVTVRAVGIFYDRAHLLERTKARLEEALSSDRQLVGLLDDTVAVEVEKVDMVSGRANLHVTAKGTTALAPDSPALDRSKLTGLTVEAAKKYIEDVPGVASASVRVRPIWAGRLPNVAEHITIEVR